MRRQISPATWSAIHREWRLGRDNITAISRRYGIYRKTIYSHQKKQNWPEYGAEQDNVLLHAEVVLDDVLQEMHRKLTAIRDPESLAQLKSDGEDARFIFLLAREIRRAIAEVKKARSECSVSLEKTSHAPTLDLEAAKKEVTDRLNRLAKWIAKDKADHPIAD